MQRPTARQLYTPRVLHFAMCIAVALFGVMLYVQRTSGGKQTPMPDPQPFVVAGVVGLAGLALAGLGTFRLARLRAAPEGATLARAFSAMILRVTGFEVLALGGFLGSYLRGCTWMPYAVSGPLAILLILAVFPRASMFGEAVSGEPMR